MLRVESLKKGGFDLAKRNKSPNETESPETYGAYQGQISQGKISRVNTSQFEDKKKKSDS